MTTEEKKMERNSKKLNKLINTFGVKDSKKKKLDTDLKGLNAAIKTLMQPLVKNDKANVVTDKYTAAYQIKHSYSLDESLVMNILSENNLDEDIIKTKQYIDEDALEKAIYNGKLPPEIIKQINDCKMDKQTVTLTVKEL